DLKDRPEGPEQRIGVGTSGEWHSDPKSGNGACQALRRWTVHHRYHLPLQTPPPRPVWVISVLTVTLAPASRSQSPAVAVACTTKVAFGAWPGATEPNTAGPAGAAFQPWGSCSARRTPCSVALPAAVSVTRTAAARPGATVAGAFTVT